MQNCVRFDGIYQADLTQEEDLNRLIARLRTDFDILVQSASIISVGHVAHAPPLIDCECQYRIHVLVPYALTQPVLPMLTLATSQVTDLLLEHCLLKLE